jgi:hypothetical protein
MGLIPDYVTPAPGGAAASAGWVALYNLDCTAEGDWDFLGTPGPSAGPSYTDSLGLTWDTAGDTIDATYADVLAFQTGTGLVIENSDANGTNAVLIGQLLSDMAGTYALSAFDRLAVVVDVDTAGIDTNGNYVAVGVGSRLAFSGDRYQFQASRKWATGAKLDFIKRVGIPNTRATVSSTSDAFGLVVGQSDAYCYHRATYEAPLIGWTMLDAHAAQDADPQHAPASTAELDSGACWFTLILGHGAASGSTSVTVRRIGVFGWAPAWR